MRENEGKEGYDERVMRWRIKVTDAMWDARYQNSERQAKTDAAIDRRRKAREAEEKEMEEDDDGDDGWDTDDE